MSDNELGTFLRSCRESVTPSEVGLPQGPRRRTPGLRRSELATLAGISVEYLARLEQGRDRHPSTQVMSALADALRLPSDARVRLRHLLKKAESGHLLCPGADSPVRSVRPTVQALLDRLEPTPAVLLNRLSEVVAHTGGYERLAGPLGMLQGRPPSMIRYVFTHPVAREAYPDWDRVADAYAAGLRFEISRNDPYTLELVNELNVTAGAPFTERLTRQPELPALAGVERLVHPEAGQLRLAYETLELPGRDGQRLVVHLPADEATSTALDRLGGRRPGALRAVSG
ncbi:helix-turn-helix domain-containing protein [Streptomyces beijiangensis]|uniref:Helix-turn-helix domain-containing protein n=1 Tax=Streptomyces beijiangensis TaxID=163361 RepID=A0A939FCZ6_9ACTN|nr:helix-turn-helix domain-containing protein [Streptomyces beijiangensis]MBO0516996.1 helix-turn-helix domain-containing protein [Streptomyces beijiangensis]